MYLSSTVSQENGQGALLTGFQYEVAGINVCATDDFLVLILGYKLIVHPGLEEIFAFRDVVCPKGIKKVAASIVVGDRACPGGGVTWLFAGFKPEE